MTENDLPYEIQGDLLVLWKGVEALFKRKVVLENRPNHPPSITIRELAPAIYYPSPDKFHPWILGHELLHLKSIGQGSPQLHIPDADVEVVVRNIDQPFDHAAILPALANMNIPGQPDPLEQHVRMHREQTDTVYPQMLDFLRKEPTLFSFVTLACYVFDIVQFAPHDPASRDLRGQLKQDAPECFRLEQSIEHTVLKLDMDNKLHRLHLVYVLGRLLGLDPVLARIFTPGEGFHTQQIDPTILPRFK